MIWLNEGLCEAAAVSISPSDRGFTLGDGLFETLRCLGGEPQQLDAHLARLSEGAAVLGIPLPMPLARLAEAMRATLAACGLSQAALRLTLTRGPGARGLAPPLDSTPTLLITAAPLPPPLPPARLITATITRRNQFSPLSRIKSLNYLDNILSRQEAQHAGADDALMLNTLGLAAETSVANLFAVIGGELVTPPLSDGALPGVMRGRVIMSASAVERSLARADLLTAGEIFLTNSLGIRSVIELDGRMVGSECPGNCVAGLLRLLCA